MWKRDGDIGCYDHVEMEPASTGNEQEIQHENLVCYSGEGRKEGVAKQDQTWGGGDETRMYRVSENGKVYVEQ